MVKIRANSPEMLREDMIFGLCNPMLDVTANVDMKLLKKYNLKENEAILGDENNLQIYDDILKNRHVEMTPGGSTLNTMSCIAWILGKPNVACFMGCIGADKNGQMIEDKLKSIGLKTSFQVVDDQPTARCAVLLTGKCRTLIAHLYAANCFSVDHIDDPKHWSHVEKALIHYVSGFFLTVCPEAIFRIAQYSHENNRLFVMNISAPFITQFYKEPFRQVLPYVNLLFGNSDEAIAFSANILGVQSSDVVAIAKAISNQASKCDEKRIVVITQGPGPIVMAIGDEVTMFEVPKLADDKVVDTNGAGDAFVGGYLAQYLRGESVDKCIDCGIWILAGGHSAQWLYISGQCRAHVRQTCEREETRFIQA